MVCKGAPPPGRAQNCRIEINSEPDTNICHDLPRLGQEIVQHDQLHAITILSRQNRRIGVDQRPFRGVAKRIERWMAPAHVSETRLRSPDDVKNSRIWKVIPNFFGIKNGAGTMS
ncbi:hypothetical protein D3C87_1811450 [compost metagenome]